MPLQPASRPAGKPNERNAAEARPRVGSTSRTVQPHLVLQLGKNTWGCSCGRAARLAGAGPSQAAGQLPLLCEPGPSHAIRIAEFRISGCCLGAGWLWHRYFHRQWRLPAHPCSRGWARKDANLVRETWCDPTAGQAAGWLQLRLLSVSARRRGDPSWSRFAGVVAGVSVGRDVLPGARSLARLPGQPTTQPASQPVSRYRDLRTLRPSTLRPP